MEREAGLSGSDSDSIGAGTVASAVGGGRGLFVIAVVTAALFVVLFQPILWLRASQYSADPRYSHCFLVPVVSALWIYDRWDSLCALRSRPSRLGGAVLVAGVALFVYSRLLHTNIGQHAGLLLTLGGLVWGVFGGRVTRACAFPLGYLLLTVPLPRVWDDWLTQPLQRFATIVAEGAFDAMGWVVVRQGNVLQLPRLKLLVEEQCSGAHSLYALGALGLAWVAFVPRPAWLRVVLVVSTVPVAMLANAVRVTGTGVLAYRVDPAYATGVSHQTAGMIVFGIGLGLFLLVDWCLRPDAPRPAQDAAN